MVTDRIEDQKKIKELEKEYRERKQKENVFAPEFHLMPPAGWLNDPNGLCQRKGMHHIFFQYSPYNPKGGEKYWGHYQTKDFVHYEYTGVPLSPDCPDDRNGVYSGCAYVEDGKMYLYYTGNVKEKGDFDYIYKGRQANTILVEMDDDTLGIAKEAEPLDKMPEETASGQMTKAQGEIQKQTLLRSEDYPDRLSCHVRDPKVWKEPNGYYMVLGARTMDDKGCVMLYRSEDKVDWKFVRFLETEEKFGFMWECPDLFELDGQRILSFSPQGLEAEEYRYQNIYQSGYLVCDNAGIVSESVEIVSEDSFTEWDMGFDFYAPQTYLDEQGRRILIGWMGMPDAEYDHDPSIEKGWQHMLTLPRELTWDAETGRICQWPVREMEMLRREMIFTESDILPEKDVLKENGIRKETLRKNTASGEGAVSGEYVRKNLPKAYELLLEKAGAENLTLTFDENLTLKYEAEKKDISLHFTDQGYGRKERKIRLGQELKNLRIFVDTCCLEIYINDGNYVMTTKYFHDAKETADGKRTLMIKGRADKVTCYELDSYVIKSV